MKKRKGKVCWVPAVVIDELDNIMCGEGVNVPSEAWRRLVSRSRRAREGFAPPILDELRGLSGRGRKKKKFVGGMFE